MTIFQDQTTTQNAENDNNIGVRDSLTLVYDKIDSWFENFIAMLPNLVVAVIVIVLFYILAKFLRRLTEKLLAKRVSQKSVRSLITKLVALVAIISGIFIALSILDLDKALETIIAGAGVSGLVIGLAMQGTLSNSVSGIHLSFRKLVRIGDWIQTNGFEGEVVAIDLDKFILREADNNTVIIPNKMILENPMKNFGLTSTMRVMINCGVGYESDLDHVKQVAKQAIVDYFDQVEHTDQVEFYYMEFGDSSINFLLRFYYEVENGLQKLVTTSQAIMAIKKAFDKEGINIPFPMRTIQFNNKLQIDSSDV
jgi:small conductance mechanosensitive channel